MALLEYFYDYAKLPKNQQMVKDINAAAGRLHKKLQEFDVKGADISPYNKEYFGGMLGFISEVLPIYTLILSWSLAETKKEYKDFVFMDYGGGSGFLCLLAKELGIGHVVYTDIFETSLNDAKVIAQLMGLEADHYILGDVPETLAYMEEHGLSCDAIGTHDVIEHIYNYKEFFEELPAFSKGDLSIVHLTIANPYNPWLVKRLKKIQNRLEYTDRKPEWFHKTRDSLKSYLSIRQEMIEAYAKEKGKQLDSTTLETLSRNTRGMIEKDIRKVMDTYFTAGTLPPKPEHPTNTCDPHTGNRAENLVSPFIFTNILEKHGFKAEARGGYFWRSASTLKRFAGRTLNWIIGKTGWNGLRIATSLLVYAHRKGGPKTK